MKNDISRRFMLKFVGASLAVTGVGCSTHTPFVNTKTLPTRKSGKDIKIADNWHNIYDRIWLGGNYWANPMEDWKVRDGWAECSSTGGNRSVHSLTHQIKNTNAPFNMSVRLQNLQPNDKDAGAAIRLGVRSELNEYRSNCFVQKGLDVGIIKNTLFIGNESVKLSRDIGQQEVDLVLTGTPQLGAMMLCAEVRMPDSGKQLGNSYLLVSGEEILGNVALISNFSLASVEFQTNDPKYLGSRYRFSQWVMDGDAFECTPEQKFGPILWSMYTLSDSRSDEGFILKMSVLTGPMSSQDNQSVELQINSKGKWISQGHAQLDNDAWLATFKITHWDEKSDVEFRVIYNEKFKNGSEAPDIWTGTIKANPIGRPLRMASLTCQNDYAFPYAPVVNNVAALQPDLVFFSGDQLYENHGGFGLIRAPAERAILNYLRKYYQFGWSFREVMRHQPTICLPDDHDVLQGNLWGEGGVPMKHIERDPSASILGGYIQPVRMVNVVHKTNVAHHPDPYDATPTPSGISCYYGDMVYGDVGFAILADRQWKSGPDKVNIEVGKAGDGEAPEFYNATFNPPDLSLLGERQEKFLKEWGRDWRGHKLKAVLSQTVFAGIATHQPNPDRYLKYDFDSSGWPASPRNNAIDIMRDSMALHICGDTHLGTLSQYGVHEQRDSNWAFCSPAIAAGWPRWWKPDAINLSYKNRPKHNTPNTGEYLDAFGNKIYIYAVANPSVGKSANRYIRAHEKGSGFGFITFDTEKSTYTMDAYKFLIDVADTNANNQFEGWPVSIHKEENRGKNQIS